MRVIDADALIAELHNTKLEDGDDRSIVYAVIEKQPTIEPERKNVIEIPETGIGDLSDGYHTFNGLYEQRMILFAALVKAYKDRAWKSYRHEDGEWCFGGGWFIVGIDTPEGSYTYHYENKYWDMFDCADLPRSKHWDGHTEADAETRLLSLEPERKKGRWIEDADSFYKAVNEKGGGVDENTPYFTDDIACSECLAIFSVIDNETERFDFCPNCGADMRGGEGAVN